MSTTQVDIVTPNGKVYEGQVNMVSARAVDGELGILPKHMPLVAPLKIGVVRLKLEDQTQHVAVSGGFIEVTPDHVTILAEAAELKENIDLDRALRAKERAEKHLEDLHEEHHHFEIVRTELERAVNRIDVAKDNHEHH
ncbi:MAG TPA: F0F1 ATP synthase subunit epsilon [Bacillales bacterium]|nr:F0F1 ATP synthase subunit epsilon [Bacillales bacterium]